MRFFRAHVITVWQCPFKTGRLTRNPASRASEHTSSGPIGESILRVLSCFRSVNGTLYRLQTSSYPARFIALIVSAPTQLPSIMLMSRTPFSLKYSMQPERTPACVVAPLSGVPATTRFGFIATFAPDGTRLTASEASRSFIVIVCASVP